MLFKAVLVEEKKFYRNHTGKAFETQEYVLPAGTVVDVYGVAGSGAAYIIYHESLHCFETIAIQCLKPAN